MVTCVRVCVCVLKGNMRVLTISNDHSKRKCYMRRRHYMNKCVYPATLLLKDNLELQPNPAYGTSNNVVMDTNPAYESYQ